MGDLPGKWRRFAIVVATALLVTQILVALPTKVRAQQGQLTVVATDMYTGEEIPCCMMEIDVPMGQGEDQVLPISFEVCDVGTACVRVASGQTVTVSDGATVRAPPDPQEGEQMASIDEATWRFMGWSDGVFDQVRTVAFGPTLTLQVEAVYAFLSDSPFTNKQAGDRGCGWTAGVFDQQWVRVENEAPPSSYVTITGEVIDSAFASIDSPFSHYSKPDMDLKVKLDREHWNLLSTDLRRTAPGKVPYGIEVEWEPGSFPMWIFPGAGRTLDEAAAQSPESIEGPGGGGTSGSTFAEGGPSISATQPFGDGDDIWIMGEWVFDCAHGDLFIDRGAWTEIHPPIAMAVGKGSRQEFGKLWPRAEFPSLEITPLPEANFFTGIEADVWINGDSGETHEHLQSNDGRGCTLVNPQCPPLPIGLIYEFDFTLPEKHPGAISDLQWSFAGLLPGQPAPEVTFPTGGGMHIKIDLRRYQGVDGDCDTPAVSPDNCDGPQYGVRIYAGWQVKRTCEYPIRGIRVQFNSILILDDKEGWGDGEFYILLTVQGRSVSLSNVNSGLLDAAAGDRFHFSDLIADSHFFEGDPEAVVDIHTSGTESDALSPDELASMERDFYVDKSLFSPGGFYPEWADEFYGAEIEYGTIRGEAGPPVVYEDYAPNDPDFEGAMFPYDPTYALNYTVDEVSHEPLVVDCGGSNGFFAIIVDNWFYVLILVVIIVTLVIVYRRAKRRRART